jgi:predicted KAP-like P-loop ATPase
MWKQIKNWFHTPGTGAGPRPGSLNPKDASTGSDSGGDEYLSDFPASDPGEDRFRRLPFAKRVAETLARRGDPSSLVIAIYGKWGEGKTTVLDYIAGELTGVGNIACVPFNPWRFADEGMLLRSFFGTLADVLKRSLTTGKERVGELLSQYGGLAAIASMDVQGIKVSPGQALSDLGTVLSAVSLDEIKHRIEQRLLEERKRIVILIDDIDRLDRREIHAVFRLIKLTANFKYTSYVLAFDQDMVAEALGTVYGSGDLDAGQSFVGACPSIPQDGGNRANGIGT